MTQILDCDVSRYTVPDLHGWFKNFDMVSSYCVFIIDGPFYLLLENICPVKWRQCPFKWHSLKQYAGKSVYYTYYWIGFYWESSVPSYCGSAFKVRNCATEHPGSSEPYPGGVQYSCIESIMHFNNCISAFNFQFVSHKKFKLWSDYKNGDYLNWKAS